MLKLIEPKYKDKIGAGQSYPLNTEQISKALEGVPQYAELSLYYNNEIGDSLGAIFLSKTSGKNVTRMVPLIAFNRCTKTVCQLFIIFMCHSLKSRNFN